MNNLRFFLLCTVLLLCSSCEKFLSEKSDKSYVLPDKLENLQALMDHSFIINQEFELAGEASTDDYYLSPTDLNNLREDYQNQYAWQSTRVFPIASVAGNGWRSAYNACYVSTTVLDALKDIPRPDDRSAEWDAIKGQALANRAYRYLNVASIWASAYDPQTADTDLGIPLRLEPDFTAKTVRATLAETFEQIIADAKTSIPLLPLVNINAYRANKSFAYGVLARTFWYMRKYEDATRYADSCLELHSALVDFNTLDVDASYPITNDNVEIIRFAQYTNAPHTSPTRAKIAPDVYALYSDHDLRKHMFFSPNTDGSYQFKGNYTGNVVLFAGISTNEMLLIRAEGRARNGDVAGALADLNRLLEHRINADDFVPVVVSTSDEALSLILAERRKELVMRGLRWMDIKRLNKEGANITMTRDIDGETHTLSPNDPRYALAIPEDIIEMTGIPQNPR